MIDIERMFGDKRRSNSVTIYDMIRLNFRPFAFVLNVKKLVHDAPIELAKGYILRRADDSEIAYIKEFMTEIFGGKI
jgi:hypothetical protein